MKKLLCIVCASMIAVSLAGCAGGGETVEETALETVATSEVLQTAETVPETQAPTETTEVPTEPTEPTVESKNPLHQELTATVATWDSEENGRISLPQVGLEDVFILFVSNRVLLDEGVYGRVYLLGDDRNNRLGNDYYLAVVTSRGQLYAYDCALWEEMTALDSVLEVCDFDGDGDQEILLQQAVDALGGAGQYASEVFDFRDEKIEPIFCSVVNEKLIDTGFSVTGQGKNSYVVKNTATGYQETFTVPEKYRQSLLPHLFNDDGTPQDDQLWVDSFHTFKATDVDGDGISEILGKQYSCLSWHSNGIGNCCTRWEYDPNTGAFEITDAWFEPYS